MATDTPPPDARPDDAAELVRHVRFVRVLAGELTRGGEAADELASATLAQAVVSRPAGGPGLRAWFGRVMARLAARSRRSDERRWRRERAAPEAARQIGNSDATVDVVARLVLARLVAAEFERLDEAQRRVLYLRIFEGRPPRAIARELALPVETVKSRLKRGLAQLRSRLDRAHGGERTQWHGVAMAIAAGGGTGVVGLPLNAALAAAGLLLLASGAAMLASAAGRDQASSTTAAPLALAVGADASDGAGGAESVESRGGPPPPPVASRQLRSGPLSFAAGRVVDADGAPLAGVDVHAGRVDLAFLDRQPVREALELGGPLPPLATSDEEGRFAVEEPTPGLVSLCFVCPGFAVVERVDLVAERAQNQALVVVLSPAPPVCGRVVDTAGRPIAGARVMALAWRGLWAPVHWPAAVLQGAPVVGRTGEWPDLITWSRGDGECELGSAPAAPTRLMVAAFGYKNAELDGELSTPDIPIVLTRSIGILDMTDADSGEPLADAAGWFVVAVAAPVSWTPELS